MNDKEEWVVTGVQELEEMVNSFYKDLFRKEGEHEEFCLKGKFPKLDQLELELIEADITDEKVKGAIFNKGSFKALGEDGFQTPFFFYQSQWEVVDPSLCGLIKDLYRNPSAMQSLNKILICLIPKIDDAYCLTHFRPISLCNVS